MHPFDERLLDDEQARGAVDREGFLRQLAGAGAQVRVADARTAEVGGLPGLTDGERPRAVHIVSMGGAGLVGDLASLLTRTTGVLVTCGGSGPLPGWVGPLDLVVAISLGGAAEGPVGQAHEAARRGARVLTVGREGGPLAAAAARARGVHVDPLEPARERPRRTRTAVWGLLVPVLRGLAAAGLVAERQLPLAELADALDAVAERSGPAPEQVDNPAKSLALDLVDRTPLVLADGPVTAVAAARACAMLHRTSRVPASWGELPHDAGEIIACLSGPFGPAPGGEDIFADPFLDDPPSSSTRPLGVLLLREPPGADRPPGEPAPDDALTDRVVRGAEGVGVRVVQRHAGPGGELLRVASLTMELDLATAYLAIGHGLDPAIAPDLADLAGGDR